LRKKGDRLDEGIYDAVQYFELLVKDIEDANSRITIETKSIEPKLINQVKLLLTEKFNSGIKIIIVTSTNNQSSVLADLERLGMSIIYKKGYCRNYVSIDDKILWYGGIAPLGKSTEEDSIIRIYTSSADAIFNG